MVTVAPAKPLVRVFPINSALPSRVSMGEVVRSQFQKAQPLQRIIVCFHLVDMIQLLIACSSLPWFLRFHNEVFCDLLWANEQIGITLCWSYPWSLYYYVCFPALYLSKYILRHLYGVFSMPYISKQLRILCGKSGQGRVEGDKSRSIRSRSDFLGSISVSLYASSPHRNTHSKRKRHIFWVI